MPQDHRTVTPAVVNALTGLGFSVLSPTGYEFPISAGPFEIDAKLRELLPYAFQLIDESILDEDVEGAWAEIYPNSKQLKWLLLEKNQHQVLVAQHLPFPTVDDLTSRIDVNEKRKWPNNVLYIGMCYIPILR